MLDKIEVANFVLEVMTAQGRTLDSDKFYRFFAKFDTKNKGEVNQAAMETFLYEFIEKY